MWAAKGRALVLNNLSFLAVDSGEEGKLFASWSISVYLPWT